MSRNNICPALNNETCLYCDMSHICKNDNSDFTHNSQKVLIFYLYSDITWYSSRHPHHHRHHNHHLSPLD